MKIMPKCVFIIPAWGNSDLTKKAIESALAQPDSAVIAIENSCPANFEILEDFKEKKITNLVIENSTENLGWVGGINRGIGIAKEKFPEAEFYCFLNNDVELKEDFWQKIEPHFDNEDTGAVGPVSTNTSGLHDKNIRGYPNHHEVKFLIGFCFVVRKKIIDQIGGLDPIFGWGLSDDLDISLRIRKIGYRLFIARDCEVFHHGSQAVKLKFKSTEEYQKDLLKKEEIFITKWGREELDDLQKVEPPCSGTIGVPHLEMIHSDFMTAFMNLRKPQNTVINYVKGSLITKARNDIVKAMKGDWLLFIDSDMKFPADALDRLLKHLDEGADIVGGLCFLRVPPYNPTIFMQIPGQTKWNCVVDYPRDSLFEVDATGSAFLLIHKRVFDKMPYPWYEYNQDLSEDLYFCHKAKQLGFKIYIDSSVKIGHLGMFPVDEKFFENYSKDKKFVQK